MASGDEPGLVTRATIGLIGRQLKTLRGKGRGELPLPKRRRGMGDGGTSSGGSSVDIKFVLIDRDIPGSTDYDPPKLLTESEIELTEDEVTAGYEVAFQDPVPEDDNYDDNHVDSLDLRGYKRAEATVKVFKADPLVHSGTAGDGGATTIQLADGASTVDDFYVGDTIALTGGTGSGQSATITEYDGGTLTATVEAAWSTNPDNTTEYELTSALDKILDWEIIDDAEHDPPRKIVRYKTMTVVSDDNKPFKVGKYDRTDYSDTYDPSGAWPPPWIDDPDTFFKKCFIGVVINGILLIRFCIELRPPTLPPAP